MIGVHPFVLAVALIAVAIVSGIAVALVVQLVQRGRGGRVTSVSRVTVRGRTSWGAGLAKTRGNLARRLLEAWGGPAGSELWLERAEEILLSSDVGVQATRGLLQELRSRIKTADRIEDLRELLKSVVRELLADGPNEVGQGEGPRVILVVGVNGVGKTTTIGKLAHRYEQQGQKVLLVAADTFRAAAIEQLVLWAERVGVDVVRHQHGADPSAVTFDGVKAAVARGVDVVIIDTAGRLHVKAHLMEELKKVARTAGRQVAGAPHQVLLVIDATTGQNALNQARVFHEAIGISGVALTKLDGTAKGGVALAIRSELGLPIHYVGLGEGPEDLAPFDADAFAAALFPEHELTDAA